MEQREGRRGAIPRWLIFTGIGLVIVLLAGGVAAFYARPWLHARALQMLRSRFRRSS